MVKKVMETNTGSGRRTSGFLRYMRDYGELYLLVIPAVVFTLIFCYWPMYGVQIAFKNYSFAAGMFGSEWVGLKHFERFFSSPSFWNILRNTLGISLYGMVVGFPLPIILALMLNETANQKFKKTVQMVTYMPYFISTVAVCGMLLLFLKKDTGVINVLIGMLGGEQKDLIAYPEYFWSISVWSGVWQGMGWGTIIYLAAITGISGELYEAAMIDGANRWQRMWNITLPGIRGTVVTLLIMNLGKVMGSNYERLDQFGNTQVKDFSYQLAIYIYDKGLASAKFSMATAVGLFQSLVGLVLVLLSDRIAKMLGEEGLL